MKHSLPLPRPADAPQPRPGIPAFHPVPVGSRRDGWAPRRQAEFIGVLAQTRSVLAAARAVGMGRESAYRLRARPGAAGFAAAWDAALGKPHIAVDLACAKSTGLDAAYRARMGLLQVVMEGRRYLGTDWKDDENFPSPPVARCACGRPLAAPAEATRFAPRTPSQPSTPAVDFADDETPLPLPRAPDGVPLWRAGPRERALVARLRGD